MKTTKQPLKEEMFREFPPLSKYRMRLMRNPERPFESSTLDIRPYIRSETFEGFTRRGIRLADRAQLTFLRDVLKEVLELEGFRQTRDGTAAGAVASSPSTI